MQGANKYTVLPVLLLLCLLFTLCAVSCSRESAEASAAAESEITVLAVGDNMLYSGTIADAAAAGGGARRYDFRPIYREVAGIIAHADFALLNQESPVTDAPPASYPCFNAPKSLFTDLAEVGFDAVSIVNNHSLDKGEEGFLETRKNAFAAGLLPVGGNALAEEDITYAKVKGCRIALIGATYGVNCAGNTERMGYRILTVGSDEHMAAIARARQNADLVVCSVHWGSEGADTPSASQRALARKMAETGADLIIGHHPHVLQEVEMLDGGTLVAYSLGNFVSEMAYEANALGAMLTVTYERSENGLTIKDYKLTPTVCHYPASFSPNRVIPLSSYTQADAAHHAVRTHYRHDFSLSSLRERAERISKSGMQKKEDRMKTAFSCE